LARFYNWSIRDIEALTVSEFNTYLELVSRMTAQEALLEINIYTYDKLDKKSRKKFHKDLVRQAYPDKQNKAMSQEEIARKLKQWQMK